MFLKLWLILSVLIKIDANENKYVQQIMCVLITDCPIYMKVFEKRPLTQEHVDMIRLAHCGFQGDIEKVWCPKIKQKAPNVDEDNDKDVKMRVNIADNKNDSVTTEKTKTEVVTNTIRGKSPQNELEMIEIKKRLLPKENECGKYVENRIIGGDVTGIDQYTWTAMLMYSTKDNDLSPGCGGSLISKRYVLTAAHCLTEKGPPAVIILGEYDVYNETDCIYYEDTKDCSPPPQTFKIQEQIIHPGWEQNSRRLYHDIALLRLDRNAELNDFLTPICLMSQSTKDLESVTQLVAAGWGITEQKRRSNVKRFVVLPIVSREICSEKVKINVTTTQICAGGIKGKDTCKGDSGGPLMYFENGIWKLAGIVSFGVARCGRWDRPAIYTWTPYYTNWILENIH